MATLIHNAAQLIPVATGRERVKTGQAMRELHVIPNGSLLLEGEEIAWLGPASDLPPLPSGTQVLDASGKIVIPGFVDCHTHLIFAGDRADEFEMRIEGLSYQEIAARGGGIIRTVSATRQASREQLLEATQRRLNRLLSYGVTTVEIKSGYGLSLADEVRLLEVTRDLAAEHACEVVPTFLGAHEVPPEFRQDRRGYVQLIVEEMVPVVAEGKLAEFCDVFCEQGVFDPSETERILKAAQDYGLKLKLHADEFSNQGGAELASRYGAVSADHLICISESGIEALRRSGTVAVLLPGTSWFLRVNYAPARRLIDAGVPVALATDCNPGSCMTENLPLIGSLACIHLRMLPSEVLTALTLNAAAALGRSDRIGSLEVGKQADVVICDVTDYRQLFYHFGVNHAHTVIKRGRVVVAP
ncbi:MAG: imidazolonepropionase [Gemmatales bacterium]|nr:imidazolonepropionase [Gemmatales bacterium]MDW8385667.1 imidazolonepropionase [Gemmatales bacterium]